MAHNFPTKVSEVGPDVLIQLSVVGIKNVGGGRETSGVAATLKLKEMLDKYSTLQQTAQVDTQHIKNLTEAGKLSDAIAYMTQFQAATSLAESATLADIIVDAVARYIVKEHGFIEAEKDPGTPVFYFSRGDLQPQWLSGPAGPYCLVSFTAPFGAS